MNKDYLYPASLEALHKKLEFYVDNPDTSFKSFQTSESSYIISSKYSVGTLHPQGFFGLNPISVKLIITQDSDEVCHLNIRTPFRIEHVFILILFTVIFISSLLFEETQTWHPYLFLLLLPFAHILIYQIHRRQEMDLINRLSEALYLEEAST